MNINFDSITTDLLDKAKGIYTSKKRVLVSLGMGTMIIFNLTGCSIGGDDINNMTQKDFNKISQSEIVTIDGDGTVKGLYKSEVEQGKYSYSSFDGKQVLIETTNGKEIMAMLKGVSAKWEKQYNELISENIKSASNLKAEALQNNSKIMISPTNQVTIVDATNSSEAGKIFFEDPIQQQRYEENEETFLQELSSSPQVQQQVSNSSSPNLLMWYLLYNNLNQQSQINHLKAMSSNNYVSKGFNFNSTVYKNSSTMFKSTSMQKSSSMSSMNKSSSMKSSSCCSSS